MAICGSAWRNQGSVGTSRGYLVVRHGALNSICAQTTAMIRRKTPADLTFLGGLGSLCAFQQSLSRTASALADVHAVWAG